ncbi:hypothetical protein NQ314_012510 [Rhamnusium bicolor]|uniref:Integrin beta n=1 Tax=Rhamnusium bicolor TaxID=1586634 RepID=A0AAV8XDJ0_9CUCU|nr:hypothetical protein NQ314_012510 [Rhamnusium bicolor]
MNAEPLITCLTEHWTMEVPSIRHILSNCLILSVISTIVIAQIPQRFTSQNPCTSKGKCHECIQTPSCAWCYDPEYGDSARCFQPSSSSDANAQCDEKYILNPDNVLSIIQALALSKAESRIGSGGTLEQGYEGSYYNNESWSASGSFSGGAGGSAAGGYGGGRHIVQVSPQRLNLKLRARQSYSIYMNYTQAEDYPVDLYYLMDLSKSMSDDKEKLYILGDKLASTMRNLTSNFRLGFGSFVDKVVMPYVSTLPEKLRRPCDNCVAPYGFRHHMTLSNNTHIFSNLLYGYSLIHPCEGCAAPYGYKHAMRLSTNTTQFSHMVKQASVSGNLDAPEGGFDAIMQSVVCRNQIGWREQARRLLVFSTDASFHYAGDGKLGGIVKPNDGYCHLSTDGLYSQSSFQDYPSIEQINLSVKKNSINVIFAVTRGTIDIYEQLAKNIEGASVAKLEGDSSNIVDLVKEQYEQISSTVELKHNASSAVSIKFFTRCLNTSGALVNTNKCGDIRVGDIINFKIDLEVIKCPEKRADHFQTIQIYPVGTYKCGICECNPGAFGRICQCTSEQSAENTTLLDCVHPSSPPGLECSGKGQCVCGRCSCEARANDNERIYGKYCECDNFSCERHNGKLCSGPDHGICDCGECHCKEEWTGSNCACKKSNATCFTPGVVDGKICSGHGECECGVCVCENTSEGRFSGKFCEKCPTCSDRCSEFKDCVQCQQYKTGPLKNPDECASKCTKFVPIPVKEAIADEESGEVRCYYDEDECRFAYVYYYDEKNKFQIRAQEELACRHPVHLPAIVVGLIAAIILIGMAVLLLWKLLTTIHDRREFARFEKEKMMAKWDTGENPIYKQATSTFKNPTYAGKG